VSEEVKMSEETKLGTKIEDEEAKKLDPADAGVLAAEEAEVEGQDLSVYMNLPFLHYSDCPWCGYHGRLYGRSHGYYNCRRCGHHFRH
jgi:tRNA(Ile2) C34 agmatinyltransferase TiaS